VRWLILALSAVCLSTAAALSILLFVVSGSALSERSGEESAGRAQYHDEDDGYVKPPRGARPPRPGAESPEADYSPGYTGSLVQEDSDAEEPGPVSSVSEGSTSEVRAPEEALEIMDPPAPYSQVVDNASAGRFSERGWEESAGSKARYYGKDYSYVEPARVGAPALFKVEIPATDYYTVYARWPDLKGNNAATRFGVSTTSGLEWTKVDQRRDGGMWVRLGAYEMEPGDHYAVQVSGYKARGRVVADAVMVVRGTQVAPPETDNGVVASGEGQDVVQRARNHIGTPYIHSPPGSCEAHQAEDCSCHTSVVFSKWLDMSDHPVEQWEYGREVEKSDLRPGDLVFFKEDGESYPITHVAIYSGTGNIIHASAYWGEVVERPMEHVSGYYGAKRLVGH
jgi:hypothetical protein